MIFVPVNLTFEKINLRMDVPLTEDRVFEKIDFTAAPLKTGEYDNCFFLNCNFSETDLSGFKFTGCRFAGCNLSLVKFDKTVLSDSVFKDCKMLGVRFDLCSNFILSFSFDNCTLNHCSFYGIKIKKTLFKNSQLQEVDFTDCDLTGSVFDNCDLKSALFENTVLEKADLRGSFNYAIDPERNKIKKARFSLAGVVGLLDKYDINITP